MKIVHRLLLALTLLCAVVFGFGQTTEFVPGEILVKFKSASNTGAAVHKALGSKVKTTISKLSVQVVTLPKGMALVDALNYYRGLNSVEYAEPNSKKVSTFVPNDTQWAGQYGQKKVMCPEAWDLTKGSSSVVVAVIDTGIDLQHEDLKNKIVTGYDFSDNDSDPTANGDHGVHTAGIVGADTNNGKGVAGAGFNCKVMPLKIFPNATDAVSAQAIIYAADHGVKVISMSYGSYFESTTEKNAINYAWNKGVVLVGGVGNDNTSTKFYPAAFSNVIAVGSTGTSDVKSSFSNFGPDWVDVAAPGENILSTITGGYANLSGTSMATPMVAGVVGLLWAIAPNGTTNAQIRSIIESTTDPVPGNFFHFGRINAFKAAKLLDPGTITVSNPTGVGIWFGQNSVGDLTDIAASDAAYFQVPTVLDTLGQVAGVQVDVSLSGDSTNLRLSQLVLEANGASGATQQVFLWNYSTGRYDLIKAVALTPTGTNRQKVGLPLNLTNYLSGTTLSFGFRAIGPKRSPKSPVAPFTYKVNHAHVETRPGL